MRGVCNLGDEFLLQPFVLVFHFDDHLFFGVGTTSSGRFRCALFTVMLLRRSFVEVFGDINKLWIRIEAEEKTGHYPDAIAPDGVFAKNLCRLLTGSFESLHVDTDQCSDRKRDRHFHETVDCLVGSTCRVVCECWRASQSADDSPTDLCD